MSDERKKAPAYQWYVNDARADEVFMVMSYEQQGIYRALLDHQWIEGSIPADPRRIFSLLPKMKSFPRFLRLWPLISGKFQPHAGDRLINFRLESQRRAFDAYVDIQSVNGQKGAQKRWKAMATPLAPPSPLDSSSSSSSTSIATERKETHSAPASRTSAPIISTREHRNHACCGVVCLPAALFSEFIRKARAEADPDGYVRQFFARWDDRYQRGDRHADKIAEDAFDFWRARWAESHPPSSSARTDMLAKASREFLES